jgi:hypothetical protein
MSDEVVVLEVWDQDSITKDHFIGQCVLVVEGYQSASTWPGWCFFFVRFLQPYQNY